MRIFLVRHGESITNVDHSVFLTTADHAVTLSPKGHQQATAAGKFLSSYISELPIGASTSKFRLWCSPYKRTRETAKGILSEIHESIAIDRREHVNLCEQQFGLFDGIADDDLPKLYPNEHAHYQKQVDHEGKFWARMPLGESRFDVSVRVHQAFGTFHRDAEKHGIENIIVVCHGVTLRAFVMQWLHLSPEWFDEQKNPGNCWIRLIEDGADRGYIYPC